MLDGPLSLIGVDEMEDESILVIDYLQDGIYGIFDYDYKNNHPELIEASENIDALMSLVDEDETVFMGEIVREIYLREKAKDIEKYLNHNASDFLARLLQKIIDAKRNNDI